MKEKKPQKTRVNQMIRVPEIRVIDHNGDMVGVLPTHKAIEMAQEVGLDLVEVAPTAKPPTCKIMDYGKFLYEEKKKAQISKKKQVIVTVKELQVRPRTDVHDVNVKVNHARKFILHGDKVRLNMRFRGREMAHQEIGMALMKGIMKSLEDIAMVEAHPRMEGQQLFIILAPDPVKVKAYKKLHGEKGKASDQHAGELKEKDEEATTNSRKRNVLRFSVLRFENFKTHNSKRTVGFLFEF